jgi:hypothetical protein
VAHPRREALEAQVLAERLVSALSPSRAVALLASASSRQLRILNSQRRRRKGAGRPRLAPEASPAREAAPRTAFQAESHRLHSPSSRVARTDGGEGDDDPPCLCSPLPILPPSCVHSPPGEMASATRRRFPPASHHLLTCGERSRTTTSYLSFSAGGTLQLKSRKQT